MLGTKGTAGAPQSGGAGLAANQARQKGLSASQAMSLQDNPTS
ncbi:hypothetical protein GGD65_007070 [Bradyrhizobium sp. CIR18]|nr:hypothetical protein [Bradyrhizobium sp. CIR18]